MLKIILQLLLINSAVEHPLGTLGVKVLHQAFHSRITRLIICQVNNYPSVSQPTQIQTKKISNIT